MPGAAVTAFFLDNQDWTPGAGGEPIPHDVFLRVGQNLLIAQGIDLTVAAGQDITIGTGLTATVATGNILTVDRRSRN